MAVIVVAPRVTAVAPESTALVPYSKITLWPDVPFGSTSPFNVAVVLAIGSAGVVCTSIGNAAGVVELVVKGVVPHVPPEVTTE